MLLKDIAPKQDLIWQENCAHPPAYYFATGLQASANIIITNIPSRQCELLFVILIRPDFPAESFCASKQVLEVSRSRVIQAGGTFFSLFWRHTCHPYIFTFMLHFFCNRENEHLKKVHPCQKGDNVDLPKNNESNFDDEGNFLPAGEGTFFQSLYLGRTHFWRKMKNSQLCSVLEESHIGDFCDFWVRARFGILVQCSTIWINQLWD